ncbi:MAG: hypothetical protein PHT07_23940 [Paludibacter sp.]|nr:hypothetical protein [Paludibacter sp.]
MDPQITLYGILWLYSLPCLASFLALLCRNAQFLPMVIWGFSIYNVWQYGPPTLFVIIPGLMALLHLALWVHEDYIIPIRAVNNLLNIHN